MNWVAIKADRSVLFRLEFELARTERAPAGFAKVVGLLAGRERTYLTLGERRERTSCTGSI